MDSRLNEALAQIVGAANVLTAPEAKQPYAAELWCYWI